MLSDRPQQFAKLFQYNHYQLHQLLWQFFRDRPEKQRDFLFRQDSDSQGRPVFNVVSKTPPRHDDALWNIETKPYQPHLYVGDCLAFSLRANPVEQLKEARTPEELNRQMVDRKARGLTEKSTKKRVQHDVVMHLKKSLSEAELSEHSQAALEQRAGEAWLNKRAEKQGFRVLSVTAQGYQQQHFKKRQIKMSTLDFDGVLQVIDPEIFISQTLYQGIGRAKAFGCGLMLVKRL